MMIQHPRPIVRVLLFAVPFALSLAGFFAAPCLAEEKEPVYLDAFTDGGVSLVSEGETVSDEGPSSALGGWRSFIFLNSFQTGTLTIDEDAGTLSITTSGLGQTTIGYGYVLTSGGNGL